MATKFIFTGTGTRGDLIPLLTIAAEMQRRALLVHHGGIGTTARALEAGIPQIICPQAFDQPDNGDRVSRLGVGRMISRAQLSAETLTVAARRLFESQETQARLAALSRQIKMHDGPGAAADVLEREFVLRKAAQPGGDGFVRHPTLHRPRCHAEGVAE